MPCSYRLVVSIVTHAPDTVALRQTLQSMIRAASYAKQRKVIDRVQLTLVDNGPGKVWQPRLWRLLADELNNGGFDAVELLSGHGNIGYGSGHNLAMARSDGEFHLILNPDVIIEEEALLQALTFMEAHPEAGLLAPSVVDGRGHIQYLCKRYPSVLDLLLRGFFPSWSRKFFRKRLDHYELRDLVGDTVVWDIPIVSGCFMLFRRSILERVNGFSPAYFLYFEDFDISLRVAGCARLVYLPAVRITHFGGYAARKGWRHIALFLRAAVTFFNRYGWKWW